MNKKPSDKYPDISDILARKAEARKERAKLPFGEKIAIVERLRDGVAPIRRAREERRASEGQRRQLSRRRAARSPD
jgi:hypothetical protein